MKKRMGGKTRSTGKTRKSPSRKPSPRKSIRIATPFSHISRDANRGSEEKRETRQPYITGKPIMRRGPAILTERERKTSLENLIALATEQTQRREERLIEEAKYDIGVQHDKAPPAFEVPSDYGLDRVILMVVEPRFVFTYWEATISSLENATRHVGPRPKLTLRFYDTTIEADLTRCPTWDIEVFDRLGNWYLRLEHAEQQLVIDVGLKDETGQFYPIARSNYIKLPRRTLSEPGPIEWMTVGPEGQKVITEVEEYTDADHELLRRILGPHFYSLLMKGQFSTVIGSSMEAVFQDIALLKYPDMLSPSSPTAWFSDSDTK